MYSIIYGLSIDFWYTNMKCLDTNPQFYHWKAYGPHSALLPHFELSLLNILLLNHLQSPFHHHHHSLGRHIARRNPPKSLRIVEIQLFFALDSSLPKSAHIFCCSRSFVVIPISGLLHRALIYLPVTFAIHSSFVFTFYHRISAKAPKSSVEAPKVSDQNDLWTPSPSHSGSRWH